MPKYRIRFLPEYNSTSLWPDCDNPRWNAGEPMEYDVVGLSEDLIKELEAFDDSVMTVIDWNNPGGPSPLTKEERQKIFAEGKRLFLKVKVELGEDYELIDCTGWLSPSNGEN